MAQSSAQKERRVWMPDEASVVAEKLLYPIRALRAHGRASVGAGQAYRVIRTTEVDFKDEPVPATEILSIGEAPRARVGDSFRGTARKSAKCSISAADTEKFDDLREFIGTLPSIATMVRHRPPITKDARSRRVPKEDRNASIRAFLYAASREDDNDYHLIVGSDPNTREPVCMTMEISGLPPRRSRHHTRLKAARDDYKAFFGADLPGTSYDFYDPPIPIEVAGSLFFDISHRRGTRPGPSRLRPFMPTIWELHPISAIVFEP